MYSKPMVLTHMHIFTYTYMHTIILNETRGHEFEEEQLRSYGRAWREEKKGRNAVIISEIKK